MKLKHTLAKKANRSFIKTGFEFAKYMKLKSSVRLTSSKNNNQQKPKDKSRRRNRTLASKNK